MSLSASLTSAFSGLAALSRMTEVVSSNVANAQTAGYVRREVVLSSHGADGSGATVRVSDLRRDVDRALLADRRGAEAGAGASGRIAGFRIAMETGIGDVTSAGSLTDRIARLEAALITASGQPDSDSFLDNAVAAARKLASQISSSAESVQAERISADARIAQGVDRLNTGLRQVADLNERIRTLTTADRDATGLMDERQQLVDRLAEFVPLREVERDDGQIALFTAGGAALLDGRPAEIGFRPTAQITADMSLASGALSGLALNGVAINMSNGAGLMSGGTLAADFAIRDTLAPEAQARLDGLARDLVERFASATVDPTLGAGDAGLFTDAGARFDPLNETGLAQRLAVNAAVDPVQGGAVWRLRDGINASAQGATGNGTILSAMSAALTEPRPTGSTAYLSGQRSFATLGATLASMTVNDRLDAEEDAVSSAARLSTLTELELQGGIDTDREMQDLLAIEQAYGANARVVQTVDQLIQMLLELGA
ncbi:flagellar hook-associated protein FlgK [Neotabrizicola shimadae]|uniref:Flagellar hook-associated protein 1 n=1 Tax=Neotabrizicola shimadae TaxID=2807096 RepID=A0A8G0ZW64_9RHOB|nr:flagellar hook-associated protein FlgK [Neotabrizicola shimadae]QYZ69795.1 flagellar hook-associated protein FlgK [Neotabrizicola shimadae]